MDLIPLRPYQSNAEERVFSLFAAGAKRVLVVAPTGSGKTVLASSIIKRALAQGRRSIFLAHRRELIKNTYAKLVRNGFDPESAGIIMAGADWRVSRELHAADASALTDSELWDRWAKRRPQAETQVGSIDTFRNRAKPHAGLIIVDEAHRALAKSYRNVQADPLYADAWHLGLTATPMRADGKPLRDAYDEIVVVASYQELVDDGFLIAPRVFGTRLRADMSGVHKTKGDYNQEELALAVDRGELIGDIVEHWRTHGNNAPTFCFAVNVEHSRHIAARFNEADIPARHVDGNTETTEREDAIRALVDGRARVLCNCNVFSEGTDVPIVKTIIMARPTTSEALALQQAGRGSRPCGACAECRAKRRCIAPFVILDHAQCFSNPSFGGLPQDPREYTLDGRVKKPGNARPPVKECPGCLLLVPNSARTCECGYTFRSDAEEQAKLEEKDGELEELTPGQCGRLAEWDKVIREWKWENMCRAGRGQKPLDGKWCIHEWKRKHHSWPPRGSKIPKLAKGSDNV